MSLMCAICYEVLDTSENKTDDGDQVSFPASTRCGHIFHSHCLDTWVFTLLRRNPRSATSIKVTCPYCKAELPFYTRLYPIQPEETSKDDSTEAPTNDPCQCCAHEYVSASPMMEVLPLPRQTLETRGRTRARHVIMRMRVNGSGQLAENAASGEQAQQPPGTPVTRPRRYDFLPERTTPLIHTYTEALNQFIDARATQDRESTGSTNLMTLPAPVTNSPEFQSWVQERISTLVTIYTRRLCQAESADDATQTLETGDGANANNDGDGDQAAGGSGRGLA